MAAAAPEPSALDGRVPRKSPEVAHRDLNQDQEAVLLNLVSGQYHGLNAVGALIWRLIDGRRTEAALVEELRSRLADAPPNLEQEVLLFLDGLRRRNLVEG